MKEETIIEGNELIAEFMGDVFNSNRDQVYPIGLYAHGGCYNVDNLRYHSSWDWLMPVVEKIESTQLPDLTLPRVTIDTSFVRIWAEYPIEFKILNSEKIEAVWLAVVKFIKDYNSITKANNNI